MHAFVQYYLIPFQVVSQCYVENVQALRNKKGYEVALFESM